jgi:hypothetical protein
MRIRTRSSHIRGIKHTLRSAPALELNLVAVTTLLSLASTATTATSDVSTSATSSGGAVKVPAWPNLIAIPYAPAAPIIGDSGVPGVPERGYGCGCGESGELRLGESGVVGVVKSTEIKEKEKLAVSDAASTDNLLLNPHNNEMMRKGSCLQREGEQSDHNC